MSKEYDAHVETKHQFICFDDCTRCCTNDTSSVSITIGDMVRISKHLDITIEELFQKYCDIDGTELPAYYNIFPILGLKLPCKFLKNGRCTIYNHRPLFCRVFPEDLILNPLYGEEKQLYIDTGYKCVKDGFKVSENHTKVIKKLLDIMDQEIDATGEYFSLYEYDSKFTEKDNTLFKDLAEKAKGEKEFKEAFKLKQERTRIARERVKAKGEKEILKNVTKLSKEKDLEKYDLLK